MSRCADFVVLNKIDQVEGDSSLKELTAIMESLNPLAKVSSGAALVVMGVCVRACARARICLCSAMQGF